MKLLANSQLNFFKIMVANHFIHKVKKRNKSSILNFVGDFKELYLFYLFFFCIVLFVIIVPVITIHRIIVLILYELVVMSCSGYGA